jgi:hypothetical protein
MGAGRFQISQLSIDEFVARVIAIAGEKVF